MNTQRYTHIGIAKISLLLLGVCIVSCNTLKRVDDDELLLQKNTIYADNEKVNNEDIESLIVQKPNSTLLGYPLRLNLYNLAKKNPDSTHQNWLHKKDKRQERLTNWLSKKQVDRLGESFFVKGASEWLKNIGEAPVIIDILGADKTIERLKAYYGSKGYFNNTVDYSIIPSRRKQRANIDYNVSLGNPYIIDSIAKDIHSTAIDSIYALNQNDSYIKKGNQFNLTNFNNERERLTSLFKNSGIYNFQESSIKYEIERDTIAENFNQKMNVVLTVENLRLRNENSTTTSEYKVHRFEQINIFPDYDFTFNKDSLKSIEHDNYTIYYKDKLKYKPKALTNAFFIKKDSVYRHLDYLLTNRQISNLNTFKYPSIKLTADSTQTNLTADIYLAARPKYSFETNFDITHSSIQPLGISSSLSLITRNIFGGAENLSASIRGTFGLLGDNSPEDTFSEIGSDINLTFPRLWLPIFNTEKIIPNYMLPQTRMSVGISYQKNIGLDKQTFNTILGYNWSPNDSKKHSLELLNVQYVKNVNKDRFFNEYQNPYSRLDEIANDFEAIFPQYYDSDLRLTIPEGTTNFTNEVLINGLLPTNSEEFNKVRSIEERRLRLTENNLIFSSNYTFSKNNKTSINDTDFYQLRFKLESAGNLLSAFSHLIPFNQDDNNKLRILNVPYSQYLKTELDYVKHWDLSGTNVLAFRSFFGIAIPYGNAENVPFVRSYFAGGSNDNRAWNPYSLGPGRTQEINDFNEANLKIALNLEYRFPVAGNIKGALFADAGNIWNVLDNVDNEEAVFSGFNSLGDLALGTGFGIRYDFTYFLLRIDTGFKTYNPAKPTSQRWFSEYNFANAVFNIGINYPF